MIETTAALLVPTKLHCHVQRYTLRSPFDAIRNPHTTIKNHKED